MKTDQITPIAGRRYLIRSKWCGIGLSEAPIFETEILEVSPGGILKMNYLTGSAGTVWKSPHDFEIVEQLP